MAKFNDVQLEFLRERHYAFVATVNPDGSPQVTPAWVDTDGENVLLNSVQGRRKVSNLARDPRVSIAAVDERDPQNRNLLVQGVAELVHEGARDHIDRLARKYLGLDRHPGPPDQVRVTIRVKPRRIGGYGIGQ